MALFAVCYYTQQSWKSARQDKTTLVTRMIHKRRIQGVRAGTATQISSRSHSGPGHAHFGAFFDPSCFAPPAALLGCTAHRPPSLEPVSASCAADLVSPYRLHLCPSLARLLRYTIQSVDFTGRWCLQTTSTVQSDDHYLTSLVHTTTASFAAAYIRMRSLTSV